MNLTIARVTDIIGWVIRLVRRVCGDTPGVTLLWTNLNFWHPMPCLFFKYHAKVAFGSWALPQTSLEDVKVLPSPCRAARGRWKGGGFR